MYNFRGDFRTKRTIDLSGSHKRVDKDALLRQAARERQAREDERRRHAAARQIQAAWCAALARRQADRELRHRFRTDRDQLMAEIGPGAPLASMTATATVSPERRPAPWTRAQLWRVVLLTRQLLFFGRGPAPTPRAAALARPAASMDDRGLYRAHLALLAQPCVVDGTAYSTVLAAGMALGTLPWAAVLGSFYAKLLRTLPANISAAAAAAPLPSLPAPTPSPMALDDDASWEDVVGDALRTALASGRADAAARASPAASAAAPVVPALAAWATWIDAISEPYGACLAAAIPGRGPTPAQRTATPPPPPRQALTDLVQFLQLYRALAPAAADPAHATAAPAPAVLAPAGGEDQTAPGVPATLVRTIWAVPLLPYHLTAAEVALLAQHLPLRAMLVWIDADARTPPANRRAARPPLSLVARTAILVNLIIFCHARLRAWDGADAHHYLAALARTLMAAPLWWLRRRLVRAGGASGGAAGDHGDRASMTSDSDDAASDALSDTDVDGDTGSDRGSLPHDATSPMHSVRPATASAASALATPGAAAAAAATAATAATTTTPDGIDASSTAALDRTFGSHIARLQKWIGTLTSDAMVDVMMASVVQTAAQQIASEDADTAAAAAAAQRFRQTRLLPVVTILTAIRVLTPEPATRFLSLLYYKAHGQLPRLLLPSVPHFGLLREATSRAPRLFSVLWPSRASERTRESSDERPRAVGNNPDSTSGDVEGGDADTIVFEVLALSCLAEMINGAMVTWSDDDLELQLGIAELHPVFSDHGGRRRPHSGGLGLARDADHPTPLYAFVRAALHVAFCLHIEIHPIHNGYQLMRACPWLTAWDLKHSLSSLLQSLANRRWIVDHPEFPLLRLEDADAYLRGPTMTAAAAAGRTRPMDPPYAMAVPDVLALQPLLEHTTYPLADTQHRRTAPVPVTDDAGWLSLVAAPALADHVGADWDDDGLARMSLFRGAVILKYLPFATHFERRMEIFVEWCRRDRAAHADPNEFGYITSGLSARIRRGHIFEDGYMRLNVPSRDSSILKRRIVIEFIDQFGLEEAGIDAGGVFKEFLTSLVAEAFQPNAGLFKATADQLLYPNPGAYAQDETHLGYMTFLGKMVGKALYEQLLIDIEFTTFFLAKWLGRRSYLDDLPSLDPTLYKGLLYLKSAPDAAELELTFSIDEDEFGVSKTFDLIPNGRTIAVTNANRLRYIYLVADYRLNREIEAQCRAFFSGLSALLRPEWLRIFNTRELQIMLSGAPGVPIDVEDLRQNTLYTGVYDQDHPTIRLFWAWFANQTDDIRRQFTRFATSCSRPPLLGFKDLVPLFCIRDAGTDLQRLPTASTCVNLLKLPQYTTYEQLAAQMEKAVTSNAGFDLS